MIPAPWYKRFGTGIQKGIGIRIESKNRILMQNTIALLGMSSRAINLGGRKFRLRRSVSVRLFRGRIVSFCTQIQVNSELLPFHFASSEFIPI